jgi:plasmid stabilization system protein ParE
MPRGDKSKYTDKQKRQARHIEEGYEERGLSPKTSAARAWATVNAQDGGGKKGGSGKSKAARSSKSSKTGVKKKAAKKSSRKRMMVHA